MKNRFRPVETHYGHGLMSIFAQQATIIVYPEFQGPGPRKISAFLKGLGDRQRMSKNPDAAQTRSEKFPPAFDEQESPRVLESPDRLGTIRRQYRPGPTPVFRRPLQALRSACPSRPRCPSGSLRATPRLQRSHDCPSGCGDPSSSAAPEPGHRTAVSRSGSWCRFDAFREHKPRDQVAYHFRQAVGIQSSSPNQGHVVRWKAIH